MRFKKIIFLSMAFLLIIECKTKKNIEFCEGISSDGKGVNCGETFSTGDVTLVIKVKTRFETQKLNLDVIKKGKFKNEKTDTLVIDVNPEASAAKTNYYFYDEGEYIIEARKVNDKIAEGGVKIVDVY